MKRRIALWALVGLAVASAWVLFALVIRTHYNPGQWAIATITAPSALVGRMTPLSYYCFILLSVVCYAVVGFATNLRYTVSERTTSAHAFLKLPK
jgi:hypothetical protein